MDTDQDHDPWADNPPQPDVVELPPIDAYLPPTPETVTTNGAGRVPPHNLDAEASLLGSMLLSPDAIDIALGVTQAADFYRPSHADTFAAIVKLHTRGDPADPITVADELERSNLLDSAGGTGALVDLESRAPSSANAAQYARIVAERATMRRLIGIGSEITQLGYDTPDDIGAAVGMARSAIERISDRVRPPAERLIPGGQFLLDQPTTPPAVWGEGSEVLWAQGEGLLLVGPTGVGKTTISAQLLEGLLAGSKLLGWPVQQTNRRVLYLAMDRPAQISRAVARTISHLDRDVLNDQLVFWKGPLTHDLGVRPETLVELCLQADVGTVFIDSLKDAAVKLNTDEVGGNLSRAMQMCLAEDIEVVGSHHHRKGERGTTKAPTTTDEIFGSTLITSGAGSVIQLWGSPGDLVVELTHLKQPSEQVGPLKVAHDHSIGRTEIIQGYDVVAHLRNCPNGATTMEVARQLYGGDIPDKQTDNLRKKAERRLRSAQDKGLVHSPEDPTPGGKGGSEGRRWHATDNRHDDGPL